MQKADTTVLQVDVESPCTKRKDKSSPRIQPGYTIWASPPLTKGGGTSSPMNREITTADAKFFSRSAVLVVFDTTESNAVKSLCIRTYAGDHFSQSDLVTV